MAKTANQLIKQAYEIAKTMPPAQAAIIKELAKYAVRSAMDIAHRVDWDFREAERLAKQVPGEAE